MLWWHARAGAAPAAHLRGATDEGAARVPACGRVGGGGEEGDGAGPAAWCVACFEIVVVNCELILQLFAMRSMMGLLLWWPVAHEVCVPQFASSVPSASSTVC